MTALDQWHQQQLVQNLTNEAGIVTMALTRPSVLYKPEVGLVRVDGGYYAKYHDVYVTGSTPEQAMEAFDKAWRGK